MRPEAIAAAAVLLLGTLPLLRCSTFGADAPDATDASADAATSETAPTDAPSDALELDAGSACTVAFRDSFDRPNLAGGPWDPSTPTFNGATIDIDTTWPFLGVGSLRVRLPAAPTAPGAFLFHPVGMRSRVRVGYALRVDSAVRAMNFSSIQVTDPGLALFLFQENNVISLREQLAAEPYTSKTYPLEPSGGGWHKYFIDLELATTPPQARVDIDGVPGTPIALSMKFRRSNITIRAGVPFAAADAGPDNVHIDELVLCEDP